MNVSCQELENGEFIGLASMEVVAVPDASILAVGGEPEEAVVEAQRRAGEVLLAEVSQLHRQGGAAQDVGVEILWKTEPVANQAYAARIRLFVTVRVIARSCREAEAAAGDYVRVLGADLRQRQYALADLDEATYREVLEGIATESAVALTKEGRFVSWQNRLIGESYLFERLPRGEADFGNLANALVAYPRCGVFFQVMPTRYTEEESAALSRWATLLATLERGIQERGIGEVGIASAARPAETYAYYAKRVDGALFAFNIAVMGGREAVGAVSSRLFGQLAGASGAEALLRVVDFGNAGIDCAEQRFALPWLFGEAIRAAGQTQGGMVPGGPYASLARLPFVVTGEEACGFFRLPIGTAHVGAGLEVNRSSGRGKTFAGGIVNGGDITVGRLKSSGGKDTIGFFLRDLTKHMLIVGTPGSGKTTFSVSLLDRLWKEHGIPFLVIEPAKNEYRALVQSIPDLQVFTPGKRFVSPFVFNPFVPPENVTLESYKSVLRTAFAAGLTMTTPLDKIFEETVDNCYSEFRWLESYTSADKGGVFGLRDFIACFRRTFDAIGYTGDARNIGRAGLVRLAGLLRLFDDYGTIPIGDLLAKPTVIELAAIENAEQKALIIALLLLNVLAYVNANFLGDGRLRNVLVLEEAHVLLDADGKTVEGAADPTAIAKGLVKRMLAEIRSYGVGLVIADQSPRKVGVDVVALTNLKLAFRLVERADREILADSVNMDDAQIKRLARLRPGEAFLYFDKLDEPEEVVTEDYRAANGIAISLTDADIRDASTYWAARRERLRPYPECACLKPCAEGCAFERRALARELAKRIFKRFFTAQSEDFSLLRRVYANLDELVRREVNDEPVTPELVACIRMHLLREVKYDTRIRLNDATIRQSLESLR